MSAEGDVNAMLNKIKQLEEEKQRVAAEKEAAEKERMQLASQLEAATSKVSSLTKKTQDEMMGKINTTIATWLESLPTDVTTEQNKQQFKSGLEELAKVTAEDSGLWRVVCCASERHVANVAELEQLRKESAELRQRLEGGSFGKEEARLGKRKVAEESVIDARDPGVKEGGMWDDFKVMLGKEGNWYPSI